MTKQKFIETYNPVMRGDGSFMAFQNRDALTGPELVKKMDCGKRIWSIVSGKTLMPGVIPTAKAFIYTRRAYNDDLHENVDI